jgi:hypothetical protein
MSHKFKPNAPCPCGSGKKYKKCCKGHLDWDQLFRDGDDPHKYASIRGRNTLFFQKLIEILELDQRRDIKEYKAAFTDKAVRDIHEGILEIGRAHV